MQDRFKFRLIIEHNYKTVNGTFKGISVYYCNGFIQGKTKTSFFGNGKRYSFLNSQIKYINQCTGLKDKHGKLTYEGDIVKAITRNPYEEHIGVIRYHTCYFSLDYKEVGKYGECGISLTKNTSDFATLEILGNIYENPELLRNEE